MAANLTSSSDNIRGPVLITGANGMLGRRLIARLAMDVAIVALVRSQRAANVLEQEIQAKSYAARVQIRVHDYADKSALSETLRGCKSCIHLVGIIKESAGSNYVQAQEDTTRALVEASRSSGLERIVYVSITGADRLSQNTCLASKGRAEQILGSGSVNSLSIRIPMVLGPNDYALAALKRRAGSGFVFMFRSSSLEQPIYSVDVENALLAGLAHPLQQHQVLELAGPESISRAQLTLRAAQALKNSAPTIVSLPLALGNMLAGVLELVSSSPPVTRAMLGVLDHDDHVDPQAALNWLGIQLTPLDDMLRILLKPE